MNTIQHDTAEVAKVALPSPKISAADKDELGKIVVALEQTDDCLEQINLSASPSYAQDVALRWRAGDALRYEADIAVRYSTEAGKEDNRRLKSFIKAEARELRIAGGRFLAAVIKAQADSASKDANKLEAKERAEAEKVDVVFTPSHTVLSMHKTAQRLKARAAELAEGSQSVHINELKALL